MDKIAFEIENIATEFNELLITDQKTILSMLYKALADEWLAYYQYWSSYHSTRGKGKVDVDPEFEAHSKDELEHAEKIVMRIKELGGRPFPRIQDLDNFCSQKSVGAPVQNPCDLLLITIEAEKHAISFYKELESLTRGVDPTTNKMVKEILSEEEEHLYDLSMLLEDTCAAE